MYQVLEKSYDIKVRFIQTRMSKKNAEIYLQIQKLLFELPLTERINLVEKMGKKLRQQNSIETNKEVNEFKRKNGIKKQGEDYGAFLGK